MILVTGGTGLVGAHILYFLLRGGQKVRAIHRAKSDLKAVLQVFKYYTDDAEPLYNQVEWKEADLTNIPALTEAFEGVAYVYHAAAYVSFDPKNFYKLKKSNIEGTANIVNLCLRFGIKKLCHISSIATLGRLGSEVVNEETHWNPDEDNNVYAISKYGAEMEVWRGTQEGLDAVVLNPGVVLGSGFWNKGTGLMFKKVHKGLAYYITGTMGFVDVIDVAETAIGLMKSTIKNERFILVSENISYLSLLTKIAERFEKKPPHKALSPGMLYVVSYLDKIKSILTGSKQVIFKSTAKTSAKKTVYSNEKIKMALGYSFLPIETTVEEIVKNYSKDYSN